MSTPIKIYIFEARIDSLRVEGWYSNFNQALVVFNKYHIELENAELGDGGQVSLYEHWVEVQEDDTDTNKNKMIMGQIREMVDSRFEGLQPIKFVNRLSSVESIVDNIRQQTNIDVFYNEDRSQAVLLSHDRNVVKIIEKDLVRTSVSTVWDALHKPYSPHYYRY